MAYDIKSRGVKDFRRTVDKLKKNVRDPLEGAVGINTVFRARFAPISSSPVPIVYTSGSISGSSYTLDPDTGTVVFNAAPAVQPTMTYYSSNMTDAEVVDVLFAGFREMESRWPRSWKLIDDGGNEVIYPDEETYAYVVDSASVDPVCGSNTFSTSTVQIAFYMACTRYSHIAARMIDLAERAFMFREDRGVTVDKGMVPRNLALALEMANAEVERALLAAQAEVYTDLYGKAIKSPGTVDYFSNYEWQTQSRDEDYRGTYAGTG